MNTAEMIGTELERFAACVFAAGDLIETRRLKSGVSSWCTAAELSAQAAGLVRDNAAGQNIYVGANPRKAIGGTTAADVLLARCLFADFDGTTAEQAQQRWQAAGLPEPTLLVHSGHGVHAYWRLAEPLSDLDIWTRFQRDLARVLGSDPCIHDPPRIMRLPGLVNHKVPVGTSHILSADPARVYNLADIADCIPQTPATPPTPQGTPAATRGGRLGAIATAAAEAVRWAVAPEGRRNTDALAHAARLCRDFALADGEALPLLAAWNARNTPPLSDDELRTCLTHGCNYGKNAVGAALAKGPDALPEDQGPPWYTFAEVVNRPAYKAGLVPLSTGYRTLDEPLHGGLRPECLYVLGGRTGTAKSTLALNIARLVALDGHGVLVFRLEESATEAAYRVHAAAAQVSLRVLLDGTGQADMIARQQLVDAWGVLADVPLRLSEQRNIYHIERIAAEHVQSGGNLVVVDQLSHVQVPEAEVGYQQATQASNRLRLLARDLHVPVVAVVQVGREAAKKSDRLTVNDLRDSGAIENDSTAVVLIDKVHPPEIRRSDADPYTLDVLIGKNRYGTITREDDPPLSLQWWPWCCRIEDAGGHV